MPVKLTPMRHLHKKKVTGTLNARVRKIAKNFISIPINIKLYKLINIL